MVGYKGSNKSAAAAKSPKTKDIVNVVFHDHTYCGVISRSINRSKVQPTRYLFAPKDGYKAKFIPETAVSPNKFLSVEGSPPPPPLLLPFVNYPCGDEADAAAATAETAFGLQDSQTSAATLRQTQDVQDQLLNSFISPSWGINFNNASSRLEQCLRQGKPDNSLSPIYENSSSSSSSSSPCSTTCTTSATKKSQKRRRRVWKSESESDDENEDVDIISIKPEIYIPYEPIKAKTLMMRCEKHAKIMKPDADADAGDEKKADAEIKKDEDVGAGNGTDVDIADAGNDPDADAGNESDADESWESQIIRTGWTKPQNKLFDGVMKALHNEKLAQAAYMRRPGEAILRRASLDKTARHFRIKLNEVQWNTKLTQWLHDVLINNLSQDYLAAYLGVLQTLRSKVPALVDRMIYSSTVTKKIHLPCIKGLKNLKIETTIEGVLNAVENTYGSGSGTEESKNNVVDAMKKALDKKVDNLNADALNILLKKKWDPFSSVIRISKLKTLGSNPVFLLIPSGSPCLNSSKRFKTFSLMFASLGKVIPLNIPYNNSEISVDEFTKKILNLAKYRVDEIRRSHRDRPLYIIGWGTGAIIAATVSVSRPVDGVITLGFPLLGLSGPRGSHDLEDPILDMKCPTLFVVGGRASDSNVTDMELLRKQLSCETSMVVIGCGDHNLRVSRYHREKLLVTQPYIDKCIVDEIEYFINLHSKHSQVSGTASRKEEKLFAEKATKISAPSKKPSKKKVKVVLPCSVNAVVTPISSDQLSVG